MIKNVDLKVVGMTFSNDDGSKRSEIIREIIDKIDTGMDSGDVEIKLERESDNKFDINAIKVMADGKQIGYIGKEYAAIMAPLMDEYEEFDAKIKGVGTYKNRPYCEITVNQL